MNKKQFIYYLMQNDQIEDNWLQENEKNIKQFVNYIWTSFTYTPQVLKYLNKHFNTYDFNNFTLKEKVEFIQFILKQSQVLVSWLNFEFLPRVDRLKEMDLLKDIPDNDKRRLWHLATEFRIGQVIKSNQVAEQQKKLTKEDKMKIEEAVKQEEAQNSKSLILKELNQKIIDEMELTLFDISVLESVNQIQYTFLDKNNSKVIYREPYKMNIKFHPSPNIFDKDYFESFENLYEYSFTNVWDYSRFRKTLNEAFLASLQV